MIKEKTHLARGLERAKRIYRRLKADGFVIVRGRKYEGNARNLRTMGIVLDWSRFCFDMTSNLQFGWVTTKHKGYFQTDDFTIWTNQNGIGYISRYVAEQRNVWTCPRCGNFYEADESCECPQLSGYHNGRKTSLINRDTTFRLGIEIEKVDRDMLNKCIVNAHSFQDETRWRIERDGSLTQNGGYELISPLLPLDSAFLRDEIEHKDLAPLINAKQDKTCGGHLSLGKTGYDAVQVFKTYVGYWRWLIYAMYPTRITNQYSMALPVDDYFDPETRGAFYLKDDRCEIRIFNSPRKTSTLFWRVELLEIFVNEPKFYKDDFVVSSSVEKHLKKLYNNPEYALLMQRVETFALSMDSKRIKIATPEFKRRPNNFRLQLNKELDVKEDRDERLRFGKPTQKIN